MPSVPGVLEFMESATPYALADINSLLRFWTQIFAAGGVGANTNGPSGRRAIGMQPGSVLSKTWLHTAQRTVGWRFMMEPGPGIGTADVYQAFNVGTRIFFLRLEPDGTFTLRTPSTILATTTFSIHTNTFYYIELKYSMSGTTDISVTAELRIDGEVKANGTGASGVNTNTLINGLATVNRQSWAGSGLLVSNLLDFYSTSGSTYYGDIKLGKIVPNGDVTTDWSATGAPAYAQVNEVPPNDDTSYIFSNTPTQVENFDWEDISPFSGTIKGIQYRILARKDDEGSRAVEMTVGPSGAYEFESDPFYLDDSYVYYTIALDSDPGDGAWTAANFNAKRFGVKLIV